MTCTDCHRLNSYFEQLLVVHATICAEQEAALKRASILQMRKLEEELALSSEEIRRGARELRDHETSHDVGHKVSRQ